MAGHVVLVGLMGSGKTTVGRRLASRLDRVFVDADDALVEITDRTIPEVFAEKGESGFRTIEAEVLEELLARREPRIIAAGGGVVLREENRARLKAPEVTTVWLTASPAFLASRTSAKPHRPLLSGDEPPREVFARLDAERSPLYREVADITVDIEPFHLDDDKPKSVLADRIADLVLAHEGSRAADGAVS